MKKYSLSKYYSDKSITEQKLEVLTSIVECEKMLKAKSFTISGKGCFSVSEYDSQLGSIRLSATLSDKLHSDVKDMIQYRLDALKKISEEII